MKLENSFDVPVPVEQAWPVLLDIERIAPCLPGASLDTVEGNSYTGRVKIKAGPVTVSYAGQAEMHDIDELQHSVVLDARGKEQRGAGTVKASIAARLVSAGDKASKVEVLTDLAITGKPAQLGRGLIAEVSGKIIDQFAANLALELSSTNGSGTEHVVAAGAPPAAARPRPSAESTDSIDMFDLLKPHLLRVTAGLGALVLLVVIVRRLLAR
jgi:uncharacterized protein